MPLNPHFLRRLKFAKSSRVRGMLYPTSIAFACLGLVVTFFTADAIYRSARMALEERFEASCLRIDKALSNRFDAYEQVLRGGVAFFESTENVSREEWASYVDKIEIEIDYPGIQGIGYSAIVSPDRITEFEQEVIAEGFPEFRVWPEGARDMMTSILYLEPFDVRNRRAFGFDMMSESIRRTAMQKAIDLGRSTLSGSVTLKQEFDTGVQKGFLLYLPFYKHGVPLDTVEQRRAAIQGFVYSPFRMNDFMKGLMGTEVSEVGISIKDAGSAARNELMFETEAINPTPLFSKTLTVENSGYPWTVEVLSSKQFDSGFSYLPSLAVILAGITITLLGVVILADSRSMQIRATKIAEEMTSSLRKREREILELNGSLEEKVAQRTARLQSVNEELDAFSYTISHDLKTPVRHIKDLRGFLVEDYEDELPQGAKDYLGRIERATVQMESLIEDMLALARCVHIKPRYAEVDLSGMAREMADTLSGSFPERQFEFVIAAGLNAYADRNMCKAIFQNLLENAVKFTGREEVAMISFGETDTERGKAFYVRDNGAGFDMQYSGKLFQPFRRLHSSSEFPGTGIGLATVKKMIAHQGGDIWVDSEKGVGTTFYFCLPAAGEIGVPEDRISSSQDPAADVALGR